MFVQLEEQELGQKIAMVILLVNFLDVALMGKTRSMVFNWSFYALGFISPFIPILMSLVFCFNPVSKHGIRDSIIEEVIHFYEKITYTQWSWWSVQVNLVDQNMLNFPDPIDLGRMEKREVDGVYYYLDQIMKAQKVVFLVGISIGAISIFPLPIAATIVLVAWAASGVDKAQPISRNKDGLLPLLDGVYSVERSFFTFRWNLGRGIVWEGILHTCMHVSGSTYLNIDDNYYAPTYVSEEHDMVCWGGAPMMVKPSPGDTLFVKVVSDEGNVTVSKTIYYEQAGKGLFSIMKTRPGQSGSPIFRRNPDDSFDLVGLIGTNLFRPIQDSKGTVYKQVEIFTPPEGGNENKHFPIGGAITYQFFKPTGMGKTQIHIYEKALEGMRLGFHVYISPPTRLICKEIAEKFSREGIVTNECFGGGNQKRHSRVTILPHAVLALWVARGDINLDLKNVYLVDETHDPSGSTRFLLNFLRNICNADGKSPNSRSCLIEFTATGIDINTKAPIICLEKGEVVDKKIKDKADFLKLVERLVSQERPVKVVIFCPMVHKSKFSMGLSVNELTDAIRMKGGYVLPFHRKNFLVNYDNVKKKVDRPTFITTTNMSEIGVNFDADICVDFQRQMIFKNEFRKPTIYSKHVVSETQAQLVQRRGRVGRGRQGTYYYMETLEQETEVSYGGTAEEFDAAVAAKTFNLRPIMPMEHFLADNFGIHLTPQQVFRWLTDCDTSGTIAIKIKYDEMGKRRDARGKLDIISSFVNSERAAYVKSRGTTMRTSFFDERDSEFLVKEFRKLTTNFEKYEESDDDGPFFQGMDDSGVSDDEISQSFHAEEEQPLAPHDTEENN